ncbi:ATP synthase subunit e, mitochondrial-like [Cottoperca gobio]|uniref:ATP synthase F(0) complex subunit e, mitochondrial n=1 Tax=Cottoperca gobio TaxID=56716 RepID=A0A6J2QER3_COTGO|nr:ATP synthase subunit e, mitochondrial [Cottoperca gobio]
MVPPVAVSPLIKTARYSALIAGIIYGKQRYDYLKPIGAEDKRIAEEEKKVRDEELRIAKEIEERAESILK